MKNLQQLDQNRDATAITLTRDLLNRRDFATRSLKREKEEKSKISVIRNKRSVLPYALLFIVLSINSLIALSGVFGRYMFGFLPRGIAGKELALKVNPYNI